MNTPTDKTMVLTTRTGDFWITPRQVEVIAQTMQNQSAGLIKIDDNYVNVSSINSILTAEKYDEHQAQKRGAWRCKYGYLHERNQQCAHYERKFVR